MEELIDRVLGVRIAPGLLHFMDVVVGKAYQANITVQNISHVAKAIKILGPEDPQFTLYVQNPEKPVAPGLQVTASVEYHPIKKQDIRDKLLVVVDNDAIEVPLLGFVPSCYLEIDPEVHFGSIVANSKVICKDIAITNHGSSPGTFKIKYNGHLPITISPTSGVIEPKTMQILKVDLCADTPAVIEELAKVKLQGHEELLLKIKGNIVNQNLELLDLSGKPLKCLHFGSVYFGTSKIRKAVIYNDSPETISWVSVLDDNAIGAEVGTDIQKSTDSALQDLDYRTMTREIEVSSILTCYPNEGVLLPFQKTTLTICFSPKDLDEDMRTNGILYQQDYALFMRFEPVGSKDGFLQSDADDAVHHKGQRKHHVELAVTGSAFPVALTFSTGTVYNFKECLIGERIDIHCSLKNESQFLPVVFSFRKTSHFHISPANGKIEAGHSQEVVFSFIPHQVGTFSVKQVVDILGPTSDDNMLTLKMKAFHQKKLTFTAICKPLTKKIIMKINPGITPKISNPTGHFVQVAPQETAIFTGSTRTATLKADKTQIHDHQNTVNVDKDVMVAFPNDRAASIRPSDRSTHYRTIFTKIERYNYVDPDYAYTEDEEKFKQAHKDYYTNYIKKRRENHLKEENDRAFQEVNNDIDIGIIPAAGLRPPSTSILEHFNGQKQNKSATSTKGRMLTTRQLAVRESRSITREINEGLNAMPRSVTEKEDCNLVLTPQQLHHIVIGPSTIDFGEVCVRSTSVKEMIIINSLPTYIWVQVEIDCDELQQTSPLSHVVPPMSKTEIPVVFETNTLGKFKKSISYSVNNKHIGHILVTAKAVPIALELSSHELVLKPNNDFLAETGFRSSIRLYNHRNHAAEFSWKPVITEKGIAFSIRPARGIVDAYEDLECEVVWHPGFSSPDIGEFNLCVQQQNTHKLKCIAELGPTNVQFTDQRILFHHAPLGLSTVKTAIIQNTGVNHAYFQVVDINPLPGMTLTPSQGVVPVGGHAALTVIFTPQAVMKFDTRIEISVRNAKTLELRIGGSVVPPEVDISVNSFLFPGVYVNSIQAIPFLLQNKGVARARVEIDLSKYEDFSLSFKDNAAVEVDPLYPHLYTLDLEEKEALECALHFSPKEVAAYDFQLPVNINFTGGLSDADSSAPVTPTHSEKHIVVPRPQMVNVITPVCKVNATVLQQLLRVSTTHIAFELLSGVFDLGIADDSLSSQVLELSNISKKTVSWKLNLDHTWEALKNGVFRFSKRSGELEPGETSRINVHFCPAGPGNYKAEIPVIINNNRDSLYIPLHLYGSSKKPMITFDPPFIILTPVPLDTEVEALVDIISANYKRPAALKVDIPEVELENGDREKVFSVHFPSGQTISGSGQLSEKIVCKIAFKSSTPVSCMAELVFTDEDNNQFHLQVAAVAENCILTVYPYLAYHRTDQVILKSGQIGKNGGMGEAVLRPCHIPETPSQSTSSSSLGAITSSTYEESVSDGIVPENERTQMQDKENQYETLKDKLELSFYPEDDSEEWMFFEKVLSSVQTWFSLYGWAIGCNPITIPQSLWSGVCKVKLSKSEGKAPKTINLGKQTKTIYDMLFYLSGQMLPGITASQSLPSDPTERVLQLHWQHATLLTFLKSQGASLSHIKPEYLFEPLDYERWIQIQVQIQKLQNSNKKTTNFTENNLLHINNSAFQSVSKRVWTDILLQIYKVFILSRITQRKSDDDSVIDCMPKISSEPLSSNIYSTSERILLTWLNVHYEKMRKVVWRNSKKGDIPPTRWIMNFDKDLLDGLVLATQVAAYCPYLISTHFINMYTNPETPEQCLHNCLILVNAFRAINLNIDIQATDICDPNPVTMLMLCVYLHEKLSLYVPKKTIHFDGALHQTISRQVRLKNSSSKPLVYQATIVGRESADFSLPKGNTITIAPKSQVDVTVEYKSRFLHPAEATMLLVSKPSSGAGGTTLSFSLASRLTDLVPTVQVKQETPCYELEKMCLSIESPYKRHGKFRVILVESSNHLQFPNFQDEITRLKDEKRFSASSTDHALSRVFCQSNNQEYKSNLLRQYFCPVNSVFLKEGMSSILQVNFLPFELGKRYCTIVFTSEEIGDFVYMIEGMSTPPLPSALSPINSLNVFHMNNGNPDALNICYLKCKENSILEEDLKIPLVNERREKALANSAQMQMTLLEYERRKVTGTLESSSVRAAVASLGVNIEETKASLRSSSFSSTSKKDHTMEYNVEISMPQYFEVPKKIKIPVSARNQIAANPVSGKEEQLRREQDKEKGVLFPLKFVPEKPGRYTCKILLRSSHDVRVFMIECVVNPCSTETELEFITPACEALIQDIPISNITQQDWKLKAILQGDQFYGPPCMHIPAGEIAQYPLMFKPTVECRSTGTLILQNETDGTEHIFGLKGIGQEPLALDHIVIDCQVRQITQKVLMVPNYTNNRLTFKVVSDIPIIGGSQTLTVKPGTSSPYTLSVSPWKRGLFQGIISFVAEDGEQQYQCGNPPVFADGTEAVQLDGIQTANAGMADSKSAPYKVWFTVEINSTPTPPERTIDVTCSVFKSVGINIPITNPSMDTLHFQVLVNGDGITGDDVFSLQPKETFSYVAKFSPSKTGNSNGSVIFQSDIFEEFWYDLKLIAEKPESVKIPEVFCELGKWTRLFVPLVNPTQDIFELQTVNSNPEHFLVELDNSKPLLMAPNSTTEVPVQFCPSSLSKGSQTASITFKNKQLKEWTFYLSGVGLIPQPMEPASISANIGSLASINISFKNPTNENVLVDIVLTDQEQTMHRLSASVLRHSINKEPAFCLPLKQTQGIPLAAKEKLDIPVLFAPDTMKLYEALVVVHMVKANGDSWDHNNTEDLNTELKSISRTENGSISGIRWIYPIHGIPEAQAPNSAPAMVCCQARNRTEERVEVLLTGVVPGQTAMPASSRDIKPVERTAHVQEEVQVSNGFSTAEEFLYEIRYESEESKSQLEPSVGIELVRKERDTPSGIVTLIFNIIFAPYKSMRHSAVLVVQCVTGGIWKFPIQFVSTEPNVDDVIQIEAVGLNKESAVGFRLTSQTRYPEPFSAYFIHRSDQEFSVSPQSGELLPLGTAGTLITVSFKPTMYSKKHRATLVVQTSSMQWTYEINGLPPKDNLPSNVSPKVHSMGVRRPVSYQKRNFLHENVKLTTTAVSSPVKGASLMFRNKVNSL
ncbi:cilia- and flagella-associated protein 47 isoform X3 [Hyla sarda]|uniref:cilia- and flagella-associated protein 47 isoform X3 n=1 Tax=Hyla sarda TaxID=327740 RepID=UPI0024C342A0|nr:cilia- and flagella-associated protein 47 isoform X3 [Hyla sarda]